MQDFWMDTQGDYMKKILMIEWKHKKIEDTCDMVQKIQLVCTYIGVQRLTQIRHKKSKMC